MSENEQKKSPEKPLFVELHLLRSHAPGNMNRDDLGSVKTARFGSVRRLRLSSQCLKRTWRTSPQFAGALARHELGLDDLGVRTKKLPRLVRDVLTKEDVEPAALDGVDLLLQQIGRADATDVSDDETAHLLFLAQGEVEAVRDFARKNRKDLAKLAELVAAARPVAPPPAEIAETPADPAPEVASKSKAKPKGKPKAVRNEDAVKQRDELLAGLRARFTEHLASAQPRNAVDVALFGRFVTSSEFGKNIDAALQVAHALGTERVEVEYDYFSAVDDHGESAAAAHLGETEFAASVLYQYACCDVAGLRANLRGEDEVANKALAALIEAAARAVPTGKKNGTAPQSPADYVEVVVRRDAPISLANAFLKPVRDAADADVMEQSIARLRDFSRRYEAAYSEPGDVVTRLVLNLRASQKKGDRADEKVPGETPVASIRDLGSKLREALSATPLAVGGGS